ncbi:MAG: hypothetical protein K0S40_2836, partial [Actinomycetospora sp.]|nr:hypothetical protein [Actinomycetospora sp.]
RVYGTGQPVRFRPPGPADAAAGVRYLVDVDHAPAAVLVRDTTERGGPVSRLEDGRRRLRLRMRAGRMTASEGGGAVFTARRSGPAGRRTWEITADGVRLRLEVRGGHPVPRRTLVDGEGVAWLVHVGRARRRRVHPDARVPEALSPAGAAFCVLVVAELDARIRAARESPLTGGSGGDGDSTWWDTGSTGSSDSSGGDSGGGDAGGSSGD